MGQIAYSLFYVVLFFLLKAEPCFAEIAQERYHPELLRHEQIKAVPTYASLYRQTLWMPFMNVEGNDAISIESSGIPLPSYKLNYLKITLDQEEIYDFSSIQGESVEFLGSCLDGDTQKAHLIIREHTHYRGEESKYVFIEWNGKIEIGTAHTFSDIIPFKTLVRIPEDQTFSDKESTSEALSNPIVNWRNMPCLWPTIERLSDQIQNLLYKAESQAISPFNGESRLLINKPVQLPLSHFKKDEFPIFDLIKQAIAKGDKRYDLKVDLEDYNLQYEMYTVAYYEAAGSQLSGESTGVVVLKDNVHGTFHPLFKIDERAYPYGGLCKPVLSFKNGTTITGWVGKWAQPCQYYPVEIDLKNWNMEILSTDFRYDPFE
jgi:hypothetical protein